MSFLSVIPCNSFRNAPLTFVDGSHSVPFQLPAFKLMRPCARVFFIGEFGRNLSRVPIVLKTAEEQKVGMRNPIRLRIPSQRGNFLDCMRSTQKEDLWPPHLTSTSSYFFFIKIVFFLYFLLDHCLKRVKRITCFFFSCCNFLLKGLLTCSKKLKLIVTVGTQDQCLLFFLATLTNTLL